jgi:hypothetical protein
MNATNLHAKGPPYPIRCYAGPLLPQNQGGLDIAHRLVKMTLGSGQGRMTRGAHYLHTVESCLFEALASRPKVCCAVALPATALLCTWMLYNIFAGSNVDRVVAIQPPPAANSNPVFSSSDSRFAFYFLPGTFPRDDIPQSDDRSATPASLQSAITSDIPITPRERPRSQLGPHSAQSRSPELRTPQDRSIALGTSAPSNESLAKPSDDNKTVFQKIFEKVFGNPIPSGLTLAYASPDIGPLSDGAIALGRHDRWTAVYDISAHTVYMPDGTKLEAHSGLGTMLDDPSHVDEKNRGATPPNVYDLELREQPFHGMRALRLRPVDAEKALGRTGLLAHGFMIGPNGESNGCVSFRDYDAFLDAYMNHKIKRLAVVARAD